MSSWDYLMGKKDIRIGCCHHKDFVNSLCKEFEVLEPFQLDMSTGYIQILSLLYLLLPDLNVLFFPSLYF